MVEIGGKPILWHIMKIYSQYGFNDFIICLGYKGYVIKEYFMRKVTQEDIDNAQDLVNKVTDKDKKKELQDKLDEAQKQFDE